MDNPELDATRIADPTRQPEPGPGTALGPYRLLERLGAGGMGTVYRARDTRLERDLAIKVLSPALRGDAEHGRRFLLEARAASALDHPNVCPIYDIGTAADGSPYIAMAYCEGEGLDRRLRRGPLPAREALDVARQVAEGLGAAHARGIVHRDIKAANVIVAPGGQARIVDFGIAKLAGTDLTGTGMLVGTVGTMAPEQIEGAPLDGRTDCWALGILLYEMLTGHRPFEGGSPSAVMHRILSQPPIPLDRWLATYPPSLERLLARALDRDPKKRFDTAGEMARAIGEVSGDLARAPAVVRDSPSTWSSSDPGPATRAGRLGSRPLPLLAAAAALAGLASAGWIWLAPDSGGPPLAGRQGIAGPDLQVPDAPGGSAGDARSAARAADPTEAGPGGGPEPLATPPGPEAQGGPAAAEPPPGWSALAHAAWTGDGDAVRRLLAASADPNRGQPPPLVAAVVRARPDLVRLLLAAGADAQARDAEGNPALVLAGLTPDPARLEMVAALLAMGADATGLWDVAERQKDRGLLALLTRVREDSGFLPRERAELLARVERDLSHPLPAAPGPATR